MYKVIDMNTYVIPFLIAFSVSAISGKFLIPFLRRLKAGQTEREDGPQSHLAKTGTPNMGGLMFMLGLVAAGVWCWYAGFKEIVPVLILTLGFGLVGFTDDYIKVVLKRSMGLRAWQKMLMQIVVSIAYSYYITSINHIDLAMKIPFLPGRFIDLGVMNIPALIFIAVATVNGTNFTDGVDGLDMFTAVDPYGNDYILKDTMLGTGTVSSTDSSYYKLTALNWELNSAWQESPAKVVVSYKEDIEQGNIEQRPIVDAITYGLTDVKMFQQGSVSQYMQAVTTNLAVDISKMTAFSNNQDDIKYIISNQRLSISGVDSNEEASELVKFENLYNLASKVISVLNEVYDKLINDTGR